MSSNTSTTHTTALVTGGSRGIGRAIAERLAADGVLVGLTYAGNEQAARETVETIRKNGGRAFAVRAPLGHRGDAAALWAEFDRVAPPEARGGVDILVNNAGEGLSAPFGEVTEEAFDRVFAVNIRAPFFIIQEGLERLRDGGRIVNISSGAARLALPDIIAYGPTKAALENLTLTLAQVLGPRGITVNAVAPGFVDTDMNAAWLHGPESAAARAQAGSIAALGRVAQPDDVADIVAFAASHDGRWVTGQVLDATGGSGLGV